jgi:transcriptional regulator GlxA family with amidase domain
MYSIEQPAEQERYFGELFPVIRHIEEQYAEPINMGEMAARARLSSTHFNRGLQQLLRMTLTNYLRTVRVQAARRLISTTTVAWPKSPETPVSPTRAI